MKRLLLLVSVLLGLSLSAFTQAQSKLPPCIGNIVDNWNNCFGTLNEAYGDKYIGEFKSGKKDGQGTFTTAVGDKYRGNFKNNEITGYGLFNYAEGSKYEGNFINGVFNGFGTFYKSNNGIYVGYFKSGKLHGLGTYTDIIGGVYKGEFKEGNEHGRGTYHYPDGTKYVGEFKDGEYHGQGTFTYADGGKFVGGYKGGEMHGQGTFTYSNGSRYVGEWKGHKYHGGGTYTSPYAGKYVGEYKDGNRHGKGTATYADGRVEKGIWADDKFVRAEKITPPNQQTDSEEKAQKEELERIKRSTRYEEEIKRLNSQVNVSNRTDSTGTAVNEANGQSKLPSCGGSYSTSWDNCFGSETFRSGSKYVGGYKDGSQHGQGIYTHFNGNKYVGEFEGGTFNGKGTYTYSDGRVEEGIWVNNQLVRAAKLNLPNQQTDLALNEERRRLEADRQALAERERRFDEEKRNREQARNSQRINLDVTHTPPDVEGDFMISIQANTDTASVKINGEELGGREDGQYTVRKVARAGKETIFTITAKDLNGNTDSKSITVSRGIVESLVKFAALNPAQVKRQPARDAVAIIIGIADYTNLPKAEYANDDARAFYDYAIRGLGVKAENIKLLIDNDADEIAIYQAFKTWLPSRVRFTTDVYVYYSGHGLPAADGQGLYLLPLGAHRDLIEKTAISQQEINGYLQAAKPKSVTIFLDSCYSGLTRTGQTLVASARPLSLKAETKIFPPNFTVISASQSDQISSSSPDLQHGIFSYFLMKGMEGDADTNRDGKITLGEMLEYLTEQVARQASMVSRKQQPQLLGDANKVLVGQR